MRRALVALAAALTLAPAAPSVAQTGTPPPVPTPRPGESPEDYTRRAEKELGLKPGSVVPQTPSTPGGAVIDKADQAELANTLADAQEEQGVCYGYEVQVSGSGAYGTDQGSGAGPGVPVNPGLCKRYAVLRVDLDYTCNSCEGEDSARFSIDSNLPNPPRHRDLEALGLDEGDLLGDEDDVAVVNMAQALPLIAAERNGLKAVPFEQVANVPAADRPTGQPGSDFLREHWLALVVMIVLVLLGIAYFLFQLLVRAGERIQAKQAASAAPSPPPARTAPPRPSNIDDVREALGDDTKPKEE